MERRKAGTSYSLNALRVDDERDGLLTGDLVGWEREKEYCFGKCSFGPFLCCIVTASVVLALVVAACVVVPVFLLVVGDQMAQTALDGATVEFVSIQLHNPTPDSIEVTHMLRISSPAPFDGSMQASHLELYFKGQLFGIMQFPKTKLKAQSTLNVTHTTTVKVKNSNVFSQMAATVLKGQAVEWTLKGHVTLVVDLGVDITYHPSMTKNLRVPGAKVQILTHSIHFDKGQTVLCFPHYSSSLNSTTLHLTNT